MIFRNRILGARLSTVALLFFLSAFPELGAQTETGEVPGNAQVGVLAGRIVDTSTGQGLREALVLIIETDEQIMTDLEGRFNFRAVPAGEVTVRVFRAGYVPTDVAEVAILPNVVNRLDIPVQRRDTARDAEEDNIFDLETFVVTAEELRGVDAGLLEIRQSALSITDGIGAEALSRFALSDASEALIKVVGASVVDGKYAVIRGLGDRYTNVLLNGIIMPTADPDRRAVQLDQFPSGIIDSIITSKTFTPDKPGTFAGGLIDIRTISFPYEFFAKASVKTGINTNVNNKDILVVPGGGRDWLGRDDGTRALPEMLRDQSIPGTLNPTRIRLDIIQRNDFSSADQFDEIANAFHNDPFFPKTKKGRPDYGWSLSFGDRLQFGKERRQQIGYIAALTYDNSTSHYSGGERARFAQVNQNFGTPAFVRTDAVYTTNLDATTFGRSNPNVAETLGAFLSEEPAFGITRSSQNVDWSAYGQITWQPNGSHEVAVRAFHNQSASDRVERGIGEALFSDSSGDIRDRIDLLYTERGVTTLHLSGKSIIEGRVPLTVEWRGGLSRSTQNQPDYRFIEFKYVQTGNTYNARTDGTVYNRFFRELAEDGQELGLDLTFDLISGHDKGLKLKLGGQINKADRTNRERAFNINLAPIPQTPENIRNFPNPVGITSRDPADVQARRFVGFYMSEVPANANYDGDEQIQATYLMLEWILNARWKFITGARYETTQMTTDPLPVGSFSNLSGEIDETDILPSLNLIYSITDKQNLRASYSRTLARPTFRELAPIRINDFFRRTGLAGNTNLKLTEIENYDLRWEYFPQGGDLYAVSLFYKELTNPIEYSFSRDFGAFRPQNLETGEVYGIEVEMRRDLAAFWEGLTGFSVGFNASYTESSVIILPEDLALIRDVDPTASDKRPLYGQSPYLLNVNLTWEPEGWGSVFTVAYNLFGSRLDLVPGGALPDIFERRRGLLNVIYSQQLGKKWSFRFNAKNLLNPEHKKSLRHAGEEFVYEGYTPGRSFGVSLHYDF